MDYKEKMDGKAADITMMIHRCRQGKYQQNLNGCLEETEVASDEELGK